MSDDNALESLRQQIDAIDTEVHRLINERARCAEQVAEVKMAAFTAASNFEHEAKSSGSAQQLLFYRPEREAQVLRRIQDANTGPLPDKAVAHIFREIMSACLALEKPMEIAYLGPEGTFTQAATFKHFGHAVQSRSQSTIDSVFSQVESEQCNYGVVPVENSTEGMVSHTLDNFVDSSLQICGEVELRIRLFLMATEQTIKTGVTTICAHQQALAQARGWLDIHFPGIERRAVSSNAEAARIAADQPGTAAIAGDMTVSLYGLTVIAENIEDRSDNTTRFLVIGKEQVAPSGSDKTSVVVSTRNQPGALYRLLKPFHDAGIMLTRIDTRPSRTETWAYVFFIEFEGHQQDAAIAAVLDVIREQSASLKVLGSYPRAAIA